MNITPEELAEIKRRNPDLAKVNPHPAGVTDYMKLLGNPPQMPTTVSNTNAVTNKYRVAPKEDRTYNGKVYHSKKEAEFAQKLDFMVKAGEIDFYLEQVPFKLSATIYRLDFITFKEVGKVVILYHIGQNKDYFPYWKIEYFEVKGYKTRLGEIKRKQTEALYGIHIIVV